MKEENFNMVHPDFVLIKKARFGAWHQETTPACLICAIKLKKSESRFCSDCTKRYVRKAS